MSSKASPFHRSVDARSTRWLLAAALVLFFVYALNFLYFFVDDEGIPFVYAQHLLKGQGLSYSAIEGPAEGYSDFLHVGLDALVLAGVRAAGWPKITVFFVGKAISLAAGLTTVLLGFLAMRRSTSVTRPGLVAGTALLALAGPLAQWSCSSLEAASFGLLVTSLVFALCLAPLAETTTRLDWLAAIVASLAVLERIDGPIYVGAVVLGFLVFADSSRRRDLVVRVGLPVLCVVVAYHAWRVWYFGDLLPLPVHAKVLYKLWPSTHAIVKAPQTPYAWRMVQVYGWLAALLVVAGAAYAGWRERTVRPLLLAAVGLWAYVATVGDWMSGFRFFVPVLPLVALLVAHAVSQVFARSTAAAWAAALLVVVWCGESAQAFEREYEAREGQASWLRQASLDKARFFGPYYSLFQTAGRAMGPATLLAYNQAGFVPFMLDVDNIDSLGICSRFFAQLPSSDVLFTEVGRYAPLTAKRSLRAAEAYLLYHEVPFIAARADLVRSANGGAAPHELMGGYYRLESATAGDYLYHRTDRDASAFRRDPRLFAENLAHPSRVRSASIDGHPLSSSELATALPFLRDDRWGVTVSGRTRVDVEFSATDVPVYQLDVNELRATAPVHVQIDLLAATGELRHREAIDIDPHAPHDRLVPLPDGLTASRLQVELSGGVETPVRVWISDLRVQGQTPALAHYIRQRLKFSQP